MANYADTTRYNIQYPLSTAPTNVPNDLETPLDELDNILTGTYAGAVSSRPAPGTIAVQPWTTNTGTVGRRYYATDTGLISFDTGTSWIAEGPVNTASGNIASSSPGQSVLAGSTGFSADAGHRHAREAWGVAADYQPDAGSGSAGTTNRVADAGHIHPGLPVGTPLMWLSATLPTGFLFLRGAVVSQTTYPGLYAVLGTTWNTGGEGAGNFRLPNLTDYVPVGAGNTFNIATKAGASSVSLSGANLPVHNHGVNDPSHYHTYGDPGHYHTIPGTEFLVGSVPNSTIYSNVGGNADHSPAWNISATPNTSVNYTGIAINGAYTGITTQNAGSSSAFDNRQPSVGVNWIIRAV